MKQLAEEVKQLQDELKEAGAWPLDDDELDQVTGGDLDPGSHYRDRSRGRNRP